jgi:hypothetical protein
VEQITNEEIYGKDIHEWLARWDAGDLVWSIEMGGMGPGYEQAIQILTAEMVRWFIKNDPDFESWSDEKVWDRERQRMDKELEEVPFIKNGGYSGAQWGAARNLAGHLYRRGPVEVFTDEAVKDRHIQISKHFPSSEAATA